MADLAINLLRREHERTRSVLLDFEALLRSLESTFEFSPENLETLGRTLHYIEQDLTPNLSIEEEVFYPALEGLFAGNLGPLMVLKAEHDAIRLHFSRVREISKGLRSGENPPGMVQDLEEWGWKAWQALQDHLYKEEKVLFPVAAGFLTEQVDTELVRRISNPRPGQGQSEQD